MDIKTRTYNLLRLLALIVILLLLTSCSGRNNIVQGYIEGQYTYITSPVSGTLDKLSVKRGTRVTAGQILFILDEKPEIDEFASALEEVLS